MTFFLTGRRGLLACAVGALCVAPAVSGQTAAGDEAASGDKEVVVVSAARTSLPRSALPNTIQIIDEDTVDQQAQLTGSAVDVVSTLAPSFSPTREKISGAGESLRGRSPLYLIDGVPQSNPLRDGSRDGFTIDPFFIERVEVIFGSNAIQGVGATGGVINYVTADPDLVTGRWTGRLMAQASAANEFQGDGYGARLGALAGQDFGAVDLVVGGAWNKRGAFYSGDGRRVGVDGTQGELQDSQSASFFLKTGADLGEARRLELMAQRFELEGDGDYVLVPGSRAANLPASAERGSSDGVIPTNEVTTVSLNFTDENLFGGRLRAQTFYQDFSAVFGGGVFGTFQDPTIDPSGALFDQSANKSEKTGFRVDYDREIEALPGARVTAGVDYLADETYQELIQTGRNWVPETTFTSVAPFVQVYQTLLDGRMTLSGGARQEIAKLEVDDFETLFSYGPQQVAGGSPEFEETLWNAGATLEIVDGLTGYASYSQGFTMADVGRILRGVSTPGQDVDTFLDVEPVVSDNQELGLEYRAGPVSASAAYFWSSSDRGSLLVLRNDVFEVQRQRTEIEGLELSATWETPIEGLDISGAYAMLEGETDSDGDGAVDVDLDGANIGPDRLNLAVNYAVGPFAFRVQNQNYFDRSFDGDPAAGFDGYSIVDAFASYDTELGVFTLAVANAFDEQFVTYNTQTTRPTDNSRFFAGRGRVVTIGWQQDF